MLTGDSLFVGDVARPDLATGDAEGRAGGGDVQIGGVGETMLGPLSPTENGGDPETLIASLVNFCTRAIGEEHARVNA